VAEFRTLNVGNLVADMLKMDTDFIPGPLSACSRRMSSLLLGLFTEPNDAHWAAQRYFEIEAQHEESLRQQVSAHIDLELWAKFSVAERTVLWMRLEVWVKAVIVSLTLGKGYEPSPGTRAICAVKVAQYLAAHPAMSMPSRVSVKLVELPVPGQSGLAPVIKEQKILMHGMYRLEGAAVEAGRMQ